jgi:anhydro-N-acetylmuramic acid kinase
MSGTSLDGLDIASCIFHRENTAWRYEIEEAECISYPEFYAQALQDAPILNGFAITKFDTTYGYYLGLQVNHFCKKLPGRPDLIASHGHTVFHDPDAHITLQIGKGSAIYAMTKIPVVSDFRSVDVGLGGQGAPLVPVADKLLFGEYEYCLNLGGIANISFDENNKRIAYDICPCNLVLNRLAEQAGKPFDEDGALAAKGNIDNALLEQLNQWQYYQHPPPKSLDKEALLREWMPILTQSEISVFDKLATVTEHMAQVIAKSLTSDSGKMLVTGGGAFNTFLVERIRAHTRVKVIVPDKKIVAFKEALAFAFLGLLRVMNEPNCLASVTGAGEDSVGGALYGNFSGLVL